MKLTKLFVITVVSVLLFTVSCGEESTSTNSLDSEGANLWCEYYKLEREQEEANEDEKIEELKMKKDSILGALEVLNTEVNEQYKDDKKGKLKVSINIQKALLDCDAIKDENKETMKKLLEKNEEDFEKMK